MEGDGVEIQIEGATALEAQSGDGVEPIAHEEGVDVGVDAAAVFG